eukprot:CAMPEP_0174727942 /NCGR_PEP_ID=MMETSP1094-20130205/50784_1 /TAXON_ID=156173 /ORGANISM="Chrysochromulina brevifilum, Strain UTEX LB 985" /LENGTH=63 /DNA_ID=CAMNT_0015929785 /DNA_START=344 /DNA_END=535 /DNA_ORIENTATION=+
MCRLRVPPSMSPPSVVPPSNVAIRDQLLLARILDWHRCYPVLASLLSGHSQMLVRYTLCHSGT